LDTAYRSFGGEVEASSTPTICRLPDSRRHQLSAIAPCGLRPLIIVFVEEIGFLLESPSLATKIHKLCQCLRGPARSRALPIPGLSQICTSDPDCESYTCGRKDTDFCTPIDFTPGARVLRLFLTHYISLCVALCYPAIGRGISS
jgi:hypothetical protein